MLGIIGIKFGLEETGILRPTATDALKVSINIRSHAVFLCRIVLSTPMRYTMTLSRVILLINCIRLASYGLLIGDIRVGHDQLFLTTASLSNITDVKSKRHP